LPIDRSYCPSIDEVTVSAENFYRYVAKSWPGPVRPGVTPATGAFWGRTGAVSRPHRQPAILVAFKAKCALSYLSPLATEGHTAVRKIRPVWVRVRLGTR
jgi:hypothetical protein